MSFVTIQYLLFLPIVFILFYLIPKRHTINFLLFASYLFYIISAGLYIIPLIVSTCIDYFSCLFLEGSNNKKHRKSILIISVVTNLSLLGYFKYYNFFLENYIQFIQYFYPSFNSQLSMIHVILPVGISFYTFQTIGHTVDVYKRETKAHKNFFEFALYVNFFPQLVAGPIERSKDLIPQFYKDKNFDINNIKLGLVLILWGLLKKVVVADQLSHMTQRFAGKVEAYGTLDTWIALILFPIQIYCDFSGYTDIARGSAKLFNINLQHNFKHPYGAKSLGELWKRWHISLTIWFRDYLYRPLNSSKLLKNNRFVISFIVFFLMGLWHGASWPFISFGVFNAIGVALEKLILPKEKIILKYLPNSIQSIILIIQAQLLFILCGQGFIIKDMSDYPIILSQAVNVTGNLNESSLIRNSTLFIITILTWFFIYFAEMIWFKELKEKNEKIKFYLKKYFYIILFISLVFMIVFGEWGNKDFIYYRF